MNLMTLALLGIGAYFLLNSTSGGTTVTSAGGTVKSGFYFPPWLNDSMTKAAMVGWAKNAGYQAVSNGVYYTLTGSLYTTEPYAVWQEVDGRWYVGEKTGKITPIATPSWAK